MHSCQEILPGAGFRGQLYGIDSWYIYLKPLNTGHGYHIDAMSTINVMLSDSVQEWDMLDCSYLEKIINKCKEKNKQVSEDTLWLRGTINVDPIYLKDLQIPIYHGKSNLKHCYYN